MNNEIKALAIVVDKMEQDLINLKYMVSHIDELNGSIAIRDDIAMLQMDASDLVRDIEDLEVIKPAKGH